MRVEEGKWGTPNVFDEATLKNQLKIKVDNFKGNSTKEYRISSLLDFLATLEIQMNYKVEAYQKTGETAWIVFDTFTAVKAFFKDHGKELGNFVPEGAGEGDKRIRFSGWLAPKDRKKKNAINHFGKILKNSFLIDDEDNFYWDSWKHQVRVRDFTVLIVSCDDDGKIKLHPKRRNIEDSMVEGLAEAIDAAIVEFGQTWRQ